MEIMRGKELADEIKEDLKKEIEKNSYDFSLAVILVGDNGASAKYVSIKGREAERIGLRFQLFKYDKDVTQKELLELIDRLNKDENVTGLIVQLPLPDHLEADILLEAIKPEKDVDGLSSANLGKLVKNLDALYPATPEGVMVLLRHYGIPLVGKKVLVIGQSNLVGKPLAELLLNERATVSVANSKTTDLNKLTQSSEVIISAVGRPKMITEDMISEGAVVVDVGTTVVDNIIVGDVDFENVSKKASYLTPCIGGVGPMTVAMLLSNVVKAGKHYGN